MKKIMKVFMIMLAFFMSFNVVYAEDGDDNNSGKKTAHIYTTRGKKWVPVGKSGNTWNMDLDGDNEPDVTLQSSKDANNNTVWTYTIDVEDDTKAYYVYEAMKDAGLSGVKDRYTSTGSDGKAATADEPGNVDPKTRSYTITNHKDHKNDTGSLIITKNVTGKQKNDQQIFRFKVELKHGYYYDSDFEGLKTFGDVPFNDGVAYISLKDGESKEINNIPTHSYYTTSYVITEDSIPGYTIESKTNDKGSIKIGDKIESKWVNHSDYVPPTPRPLNSWSLVKNVTGSSDEIESYKFLVSMTNLDPYTNYSINKSDGQTQEFRSDENGNKDVTVELKKDQTATFDDVPVGSTYQVMEYSGKDYISSYSVSDAKNTNQIESVSATSDSKNINFSAYCF